jgi:hypothetical protein
MTSHGHLTIQRHYSRGAPVALVEPLAFNKPHGVSWIKRLN